MRISYEELAFISSDVPIISSCRPRPGKHNCNSHYFLALVAAQWLGHFDFSKCRLPLTLT